MPQNPATLDTASPLYKAWADFGVFCDLLGHTRMQWQLDAMRLERRTTVLIAPRQTGKSESIALRAIWGAFRKPGVTVLVVSASETASVRLLATIRDFCEHDLLGGSVEDDTKTRVVLSNGSKIISVPASPKSIRGWTVDLLIIDEAAFIEDDILVSAALPTTTAKKDAKIILSSTPWGDAGAFYTMAMSGDDGDPNIKTHRWKLQDAPWVSEAQIDLMRKNMSPDRFAAEYEGAFVSAADAYFNRKDLLACTASFPLMEAGRGMPAACGLDWGRQQDAHAIVLSGVLDDYGVNDRPLIVVPWLETSRRNYTKQIDKIMSLAKMWELRIRTETNGVGAYPSEELERRLGGWIPVLGQAASQKTKEDYYGRLKFLFQDQGIVIPHETELLRQLGGLTAEPTMNGGLRIAARTENLHDDLPDALALSVGLMPKDIAKPRRRAEPEGIDWYETSTGIKVPYPMELISGETDWSNVYLGEEIAEITGEADDGPNPWMNVYGKGGEGFENVLEKLRAMADK